MCPSGNSSNRSKQNKQKRTLRRRTQAGKNLSPSADTPLCPSIDTLPAEIRNYVAAISESIQTPVDMAGCAALSVIATSIQGKYKIQGKRDWTEPLNIYLTEIAPPSERKSAVQHAMVKPVSDYENQYNHIHAAEVETSRMHKRILERRQKTVEDQVSKGKATKDDVEEIARELTEYEVKKPLRLFADDITPGETGFGAVGEQGQNGTSLQ